MRRNSYVDNQGNAIDQGFVSKKPILNFFFVFGTIVPLILIGLIIYTAVINNNCNNVYNQIKKSTLEYLKETNQKPIIEGDSVTVSLSKLYKGKYLNTFYTNKTTCVGTVKATKYKNDFIYTIDLTTCKSCTTSDKYKGWSEELNYYPKNKVLIDVTPYYNYYQRQTVVTNWSRYYEKEELKTKKSKYGINIPKDKNNLPTVPEEGSVVEIQKQEILNYRYKDKRWKWYDIPGNYSAFSSEKPDGYTTKDEGSKIYTDWSEYSLTHPGEKPYREVQQTTGYQFYYVKDGKKVYANNKNYVAAETVDQKKYTLRENKTVSMYRYRDAKWRWYNGTKRKYSGYYSERPSAFKYRDDETVMTTEYSSWSDKSSLTPSNKSYRTEETKVLTRFRFVYEILSDPVLKTPVTKKQFENLIGIKVENFIPLENYKMEVSYKFKYRKR